MFGFRGNTIKWKIGGLCKLTGLPKSIVVKAEDQDEAINIASDQGVMVEYALPAKPKLDTLMLGHRIVVAERKDKGLLVFVSTVNHEEVKSLNTTAEEVGDFFRFYITKPSCAIAISKQCQTMFKSSFSAWRELQGPQENGKLIHSMTCIGFSKEGYRCMHSTKNPSGLCHIHSKPGANTMWNAEFH